MGMHDGHRDRLKKRFKLEGLEGFQDHNALELLLFYSIPRIDTNPIAHDLIHHCGDFCKVFETDYEELSKVSKVGDSTCSLIKLVSTLCDVMTTNGSANCKLDKDLSAAMALALNFFKEADTYSILIVFLNAKNRITHHQVYADYWTEGIESTIRRITETTLNFKVPRIIVYDNPQKYLSSYSKYYNNFSSNLFESLSLIDVTVVDYLNYQNGSFVSRLK